MRARTRAAGLPRLRCREPAGAAEVLVPQAPARVSLGPSCPGSPPALCAFPRFPDPALPRGAPSLPPAPCTGAARVTSRAERLRSPVPRFPLTPQLTRGFRPVSHASPSGSSRGPRRGSWRPSPESEAPVEGEGAERAERLSRVGRALGEGDAGRCRRRGRRPARGGRPRSPSPCAPPQRRLRGAAGRRRGLRGGLDSHRVLQTPARDAGAASCRPPSPGEKRAWCSGCGHLEPLGEGVGLLRPRGFRPSPLSS